MELRQELRIEQIMICPVCKQRLDDEKMRDILVEARLFGTVRYAICAHCLQEVKKPWSKDYKNRWDKETRKKAAHKIEVEFVEWLKNNIELKTLTMTDYMLYKNCFLEGSGAMADWIREMQ